VPVDIKTSTASTVARIKAAANKQRSIIVVWRRQAARMAQQASRKRRGRDRLSAYGGVIICARVSTKSAYSAISMAKASWRINASALGAGKTSSNAIGENQQNRAENQHQQAAISMASKSNRLVARNACSGESIKQHVAKWRETPGINQAAQHRVSASGKWRARSISASQQNNETPWHRGIMAAR